MLDNEDQHSEACASLEVHADSEVNNDPDNVGPIGVEINNGEDAGTESKEVYKTMQTSQKAV